MNGQPTSPPTMEKAHNDDNRSNERPTALDKPKNQNSDNADTRTKPPKHDTYDKTHLAVLILAFLAACAAAYEAARLADLTEQLVRDGQESSRQQAELTRTAITASSRAWIAPQNVVLLDDLAKGKSIKFEVQYNNVGKEPALDVRPIYTIKPVEVARFNDNTFNAIIEADEICKDVKIAPGADVVYPDQPGGYKLFFSTPDNWIKTDDIVNGKSAVIVEMCFAYKTAREVHRTAFCYFYLANVSPGRQFNICMAGNHAD